jgi:hypothetical protein
MSFLLKHVITNITLKVLCCVDGNNNIYHTVVGSTPGITMHFIGREKADETSLENCEI